MDAAAKSVRALTHDITLSQVPYHLSRRPDKKYPRHHDDRRFEEYFVHQLQYLTFLPDADRGVLLTRPDYDMREDLKPAAREPDGMPRTTSEKKKMTLSDYKNKKTPGPNPAASTSTSPPEPLIAKKKESERAHAAAATPSADPRPSPDARRTQDTKRAEVSASRPSDHESSKKSKHQVPRETLVDTSLPPKPPAKSSQASKLPTSESRKRPSDVDGDSRPMKRSKPDDRLQPPRDESIRRREKEPSPLRDSTTSKEGKTSVASSLPNGRSILKGAIGSGQTSSPTSRSRGNSVNGVRPGATTASGSIRGTPTKPDTSSKTSVPPLLSPLNLDMDGHGHGHGSASRADKKPREPAAEGAKPAKHKHSDSLTGGTKHKTSVELPPLLSPTLPPEVEAELERFENEESPPADRKVKPEKDSMTVDRKPRLEYPDENGTDEKTHRRRLIVTLKIPKRQRQAVRRILALQPRKDGQRHERSVSSEAAPASQARKRPAIPEPRSEMTPLKRPRTADLSAASKLPPPTTPSKKGVAMSRVSSTNSPSYTPGEPPSVTPSMPERLMNGQSSYKLDGLDATALREKSDALINVAKRLKREADNYMKSYHDAGGADATDRARESSLKLGCTYTLESIMTFMVAFHAQDLHRAALNKPAQAEAWFSIFKFVESRRAEMKGYPPLYCLFLLLRATADEQFLSAHATQGAVDAALTVPIVLNHQRHRAKALAHLHEATLSIEDPDLRPAVLPWATVDEVADMSLRVMKRWTAGEGVDWEPDIPLR